MHLPTCAITRTGEGAGNTTHSMVVLAEDKGQGLGWSQQAMKPEKPGRGTPPTTRPSRPETPCVHIHTGCEPSPCSWSISRAPTGCRPVGLAHILCLLCPALPSQPCSLLGSRSGTIIEAQHISDTDFNVLPALKH